MTQEEYIRLESTYGPNNTRPTDVVIARGKGVWVWDTDGNRYLDCVAAFGTLNHGHCHPKIHKVFSEQAEKVGTTSAAFRNDQAGPFFKEICDLTGSRRALLLADGAVETALLAACTLGYLRKKIPEGKAEIVVCSGNTHGRALSGFVCKSVPFGDSKALKEAISSNTAGFLVEPIQGTGGISLPPVGYLREVRKLCTANNVCLVLDETQTGLGRTGKLLAEEHEAVKADITILGNSLGAGYCPVSAVLSRGEALDLFEPDNDQRAFGANPLAGAVGKAVLRVLVEEGLVENAAKMGAHLRKEIEGLGSSFVAGVQGTGMLLGIGLTPEAAPAEEWCRKLTAEGLLTYPLGESTIRFSPPLTMDDEEAGWALERLAKILKG